MNKRKIVILVAFDELTFGIGLKGDYPEPKWFLKDDMIGNFKKESEGNVNIMGRKTYESLPDNFRPLPKRYNFIISGNPDYVPSKANNMTLVFFDLKEALKEALENVSTIGTEQICIIGGGQIYKQFLDMVKEPGFLEKFTIRLIMTKVKGTFQADTFFPATEYTELFSKGTKVEPSRLFEQSERNSHAFEIEEYIL